MNFISKTFSTQTRMPSPRDTERFLAATLPSNPHRHGHRQEFSQSNLVSDNQVGHLSAQVQDPNLINPWGISLSPTSPFWIANNHTGTSTLYRVDPHTNTTTDRAIGGDDRAAYRPVRSGESHRDGV